MVWQVRTLTPATAFTDPTTGTRATLQQFGSPVQILGREPPWCARRSSSNRVG